MNLTVTIKEAEYDEMGNWDGPKELFPTINVDQETGAITVTYYSVSNKKRGQWGLTHEHNEQISADGQAVLITGLVGLRNDRRHTGGRQKFCFGVFVGDSGHIYVHRAPATKGWLECPPEKLLARLRKIGIGADRGVIQQGDFLLKPANGNSYPDEKFAHETMGAGHHKFTCPVMYCDGEHGRQYFLKEPATLVHEAVDGIQHPTIHVPPGKYIVGTTATSLNHSNRRD